MFVVVMIIGFVVGLIRLIRVELIEVLILEFMLLSRIKGLNKK